jgi:predicted DNA-binding WGR domain protein/cell wall assembly regulator SMI1
MPRFEFSEGTANKFWEVKVEGVTLITSWGRIGTNGQSKTKTFASSTEAQAEYDKLIREKTREGYREVGSPGVPKTAAATAPQAAGDEPREALTSALQKVDAAMSKADRPGHAKLRAGATEADLAGLAKHVFGGASLPADLRIWFGWHDGQEGTTGIVPDQNRTLLSVQQAMEAWKFLGAESELPWKPSWLPLMENGAGDYVVYDEQGRLLSYWHDDEDRPIENKSLLAWAEATAMKWRQEAKPASASKGRLQADFSKTEWQRCPYPAEDAYANHPIGTAFYFLQHAQDPALLESLGHKADPRVEAFIKLAPDQWLWAFGATMPRMMARVDEELSKTPKKLHSDGAIKRDSDVRWDLRPQQVEAAYRGSPKPAPPGTPHVGLYQGYVEIRGE